MVDDPSTYVDVLRSGAKSKRKVESLLKARRKTWQEAKAPADVERERLFGIIEDLVQWARDEIRQSWRRACAENTAILAPKSRSTTTGCPPSTIPLPVAAPCRSRRSGSGWRHTRAT